MDRSEGQAGEREALPSRSGILPLFVANQSGWKPLLLLCIIQVRPAHALEQPSLDPCIRPPALAELFAHAEKTKGSPLSEAEMHRIRDKGACIMMTPELQRDMDQRRGYRDVNPENCLADWQRLRVSMTGNGFLPKLILCLPGDDRFRADCEPILLQAGVAFEIRGHDAAMVRAFDAARFRSRPSLSDGDFQAIGRHTTVLYVLSENYAPPQAPAVTLRFLRLGRQLLDAGAIAIWECESSGVAHSAALWKRLADVTTYDSAPDPGRTLDSWNSLFSAYLQYPIQSETDFYSCGLHLLGQPDLIVSCEVMEEAKTSESTPTQQTLELFDGFGLYLLAEVGDRGFTSGHTFRLNAEARRYRVVWEFCTGYDEDEFFFNPYGRWRFRESVTRSS